MSHVDTYIQISNLDMFKDNESNVKAKCQCNVNICFGTARLGVRWFPVPDPPVAFITVCTD